MTWRLWLLAALAFALAFVLFMPFGCVVSSEGPWSCQTILGLELPGFSGVDPPSQSYWPPIVAGLIAAVVVIGGATLARRARSR